MVFSKRPNVLDYLYVCVSIALSEAGNVDESYTMLSTPRDFSKVSLSDGKKIIMMNLTKLISEDLATQIYDVAYSILCTSGDSQAIVNRLFKSEVLMRFASDNISGFLKTPAPSEIVVDVLVKIADKFYDNHMLSPELFPVLNGAIQKRMAADRSHYMMRLRSEQVLDNATEISPQVEQTKESISVSSMSAIEFAKACDQMHAASKLLFDHVFMYSCLVDVCFSLWDWVCCVHANRLRDIVNSEVPGVLSSPVDDSLIIGALPDKIPPNTLHGNVTINPSYRTKLTHIFMILDGVSSVVFDRRNGTDLDAVVEDLVKNHTSKKTSGFSLMIDHSEDLWKKYEVAAVVVRGLVACRDVYWNLIDTGIEVLSVDPATFYSKALAQSGYTLKEAISVTDMLRRHVSKTKCTSEYFLSCLSSCGSLISDIFYRKSEFTPSKLKSPGFSHAANTLLSSTVELTERKSQARFRLQQVYEAVVKAISWLKDNYFEIEGLSSNKSLAQVFNYEVSNDPGAVIVKKDRVTGRYEVKTDSNGVPLTAIDYCGAKSLQFMSRWGTDPVNPYRIHHFLAVCCLHLLQVKKKIEVILSKSDIAPSDLKHFVEMHQHLLQMSGKAKTSLVIKSLLSGVWGEIDYFLLSATPEITSESKSILDVYCNYYNKNNIKSLFSQITEEMLLLQTKFVAVYFPDFCERRVKVVVANADSLQDMLATSSQLLVTDKEFTASLQSGYFLVGSDSFLYYLGGASVTGRKKGVLYVLHVTGKWVLASGETGKNWYMYSEVEVGGMKSG